MKKKMDASRRKFIYNLGMAGLGITVVSATNNCNEEKAKQKPMQNKNGKLGIALVGLGNYATNQLATALQHTELCYLAGITGLV